jgi:hypothetical protein
MYEPATNRMMLYGGASGTDVWVLTNANGLDCRHVQRPASGGEHAHHLSLRHAGLELSSPRAVFMAAARRLRLRRLPLA